MYIFPQHLYKWLQNKTLINSSVVGDQDPALCSHSCLHHCTIGPMGPFWAHVDFIRGFVVCETVTQSYKAAMRTLFSP